jgi:hypothetical protein
MQHEWGRTGMFIGYGGKAKGIETTRKDKK